MIELVELPDPPKPFAIPPGASISDALSLYTGAPVDKADKEEPVAAEPAPAPIVLEDIPEPPAPTPNPGPVLVALLAAELGCTAGELLAALRRMVR